MNKVFKCKPVDMAEEKFDLVEALLKGDAFTHWMEFKCAETTCVSKRPDRTDKLEKGIYDNTYKKAYLRNYVKKPNELSIKNTTAQLRKVNDILTHFPVPGNTPIAEDKLCDITYCM
eukprot:14429581-Ditylum_brightwellii.AAC.1